MIILKILAVSAGNDYIEMSAKGFEEISPQRKYHGISTQISSVLFLLPKMWTCRRKRGVYSMIALMPAGVYVLLYVIECA